MLNEENTNNVAKTDIPGPSDDQIRIFLARATVFLMPLPFIVYLFTRDIAVVATSTIIGIAVTSVFGYYFRHRKD